ncbi:MAG: LysR family transcriptional regulator [Devosia sp.]|nr:LysR family transcriptional regulator [Devosia sp.]
MDKLLSQFLAVADAGTLSGGAKALLITQPTLTINMRKLEESIGAPLFERSSRGVRLTRYGETLYENARLMQRLYDNTLSSIADQKRDMEQGLAIGTGYSWWSLFLKDMVLDYQREFPGSPVQISLGHQFHLLDQLLSGDIALFLGHETKELNPAVMTDFIPLTEVHNGYFVRAGHPLLGQPRQREEIEHFPMVTSTPPESRHQRFFDPNRWRSRMKALFEQTDFVFGSNSLAACVDYTLATEAVLPHSHVMREHFEALGLRQLEVLDEATQFLVGIHVLKERRGEKRIEPLIERTRQAAARAFPPAK